MNHTEALKCIRKRAGLKLSDVAARAGLNSRQLVSKLVLQKDVQLHKIVALLDAMGYEVAVMPKDCPPLPEDVYVLRREDYQ